MSNMMPPQAVSIDRSPAGQQAFASEAGVEASDFWDTITKVGSVAGPLLGSFL